MEGDDCILSGGGEEACRGKKEESGCEDGGGLAVDITTRACRS